eukprot:TRINITY_DN6050_c0_g3_i2.p1 TRINITY_DN6050_c0_g3~~TRINITY_DN6050_c0_g3_i2.p1  ORF type:complete len:671 (+),score=284.50 TRINITY_DN6050_c0_g3_i2:190-2202(+)
MPDAQQLAARIKELEEREAEKNKELDDLRARVADYKFNESMQPVEQRLTQTPYSRKRLGNAGASQGPAESTQESVNDDLYEPSFISQPVVDGEKAPTPFLQGLQAMQSLVAGMQQEISRQQSLHHANTSAADAQPGAQSSAEEEARLRTELTETRTKLEETEVKLKNLSTQWNHAGRQYEEERAALSKELAEAQSEKAQKDQKAGEEVESALKALQGEHAIAQKLVEELQQKLHSTEGLLAAKTEEAEGLQSNAQTMRTSLETFAKDADAAVAKEKSEKSKLSKRLEAVQIAQTSNTQRLEALTTKLAAAEKRSAELTKSLDESQKGVTHARMAEHAARDEYTRISGEMAATRKENEALQASRAEAVEAARKEGSESNTKQLNKIKAEKKEREAEVSTLKEERLDLEGKIGGLRKSLDAGIAKQKTLQAELDQAKADLAAASKLAAAAAAAPAPVEVKTETKKQKRREEDDAEEDPTAPSPTKRRRASKLPVVTLSGFREQATKKEMFTGVKGLGGQMVKLGVDQFDDKCTHMIIPDPSARTVKTVAAVLTGKWVMTSLWVRDSIEAGHFLDESQYGYRLSHEGINERLVFITASFKDASPERHNQALQLIEYGGGKVVEAPDNADIILRAAGEKKGKIGGLTFNNTWENFIAWVFPADWRPPVALARGE